ncbi:unnamed protein product [Musa acuminata var. zebrina]
MLSAPSPALHSQLAASMQPSLSAAKRGAAAGTKGKKPKSPGASSAKSMHYPSAGLSGRGQIANENYSGAVVAGCCSARSMLHKVSLCQMICPEDIRWEVEEDPGIVLQSGQVASRRGVKRTTARGGGIPGAGRGRGSLKNQKKKDFLLSQNSIGKKSTGNIEILQTDTLIKEVEKLLGASHPDPLKIEKAQQMLEKHEQALIDANANLDDAYDGERGREGNHYVATSFKKIPTSCQILQLSQTPVQFSHGKPMDKDQGWRNPMYGGNQHGANYNHDMAVDVGEGSEDDRMVAGGIALGYQHYATDDDM